MNRQGRNAGFLVVLLAMLLMPGIAAADDFGRIADNLDLRKNTKLHVKEYWKTVEGTEFASSGRVVDVRGGRGKAQVLVLNRSRTPVRGHNIVLIVYDVSAAAGLKKGQSVKFKGYLHSYDADRRGAVVLTVRDAQLR